MSAKHTETVRKPSTPPKRSLAETGGETGIELTVQDLSKVAGGFNFVQRVNKSSPT